MAKLETLTDAFNQNTLNTSNWTQFTAGSATMAYSSSGAETDYPVSTTSSTDGDITTATTYDLTNSYAYLHTITMPGGGANPQVLFRLHINFANNLRWAFSNGSIFAQYVVASAITTVYSATYSSTTHAYLRIREGTGAGAGGTAGTVYWDSSTDGVTWTNRGSVADPITITALTVLIGGISLGTAASPGKFKWNNFNTIPAASTPTSATMSLMGV